MAVCSHVQTNSRACNAQMIRHDRACCFGVLHIVYNVRESRVWRCTQSAVTPSALVSHMHDDFEKSLLRPHVVIIGGGFAGLNTAKRLARATVRVTLIDRENHHLFQPLLYQVATAALSPADIATPIRSVLRHQENTDVIMGNARSVDLDKCIVHLKDGQIAYDYLILAIGATHSYFGHDDWRTHAPGLKTIDDALEIRRRVLLAFEEAEREEDEQSRRAKLTFVVVGGGPTGVELAGALKEIAAESIQRDFRHIDTSTARVILIEAAPRLLGGMPDALSHRAKRDLVAMGVEVLLDSPVTSVSDAGVEVGNSSIAAENVFWAAGVRGHDLVERLDVPLDSAGRIVVEPDLTIPGHRNVFAIGDIAHANDDKLDMVPGVAPAAIQMGRYVGGVIARETGNGVAPDHRAPFRYRDKGTIATIGRAKAVASIGRLNLTGFIAWVLWGVVHIAFLIGFRRRVFVLLSWLWNYIVFTKGARLITGDVDPQIKQPR